MTNNEPYIEVVKDWLQQWIIGQNLCPFAHLPFRENKIKYVVYAKDEILPFSELLISEARYLLADANGKVETTLIIAPLLFQDFKVFWSYTGFMESVFKEYDLEGFIQLVTFHPEFIFEGSKQDDPWNFTNRSPFPIVHLLREDSISKAVDNYPDINRIPENNQNTLNQIGIEALSKQLAIWKTSLNENL